MDGIERVIRGQHVYSVLPPIVELSTGAVVGHEALFTAARAQGLLAALDMQCRRAALRAAVEHGLTSPQWLFVNVEPEVLEQAPMEDLLAIADGAPHGLQIVLELTERSLGSRPAEMLRTVARLRSAGWRIALDDVGADDVSLAFMPLLRPEVVKLDLSLVQQCWPRASKPRSTCCWRGHWEPGLGKAGFTGAHRPDWRRNGPCRSWTCLRMRHHRLRDHHSTASHPAHRLKGRRSNC